jgi:hypothetical protein
LNPERKCLQSPKTAQQLFGSLLEKAFQFPVKTSFFVDGKPVITFWGFVNLNESAATMCSNACVNRYSGACSRYRARTRA